MPERKIKQGLIEGKPVSVGWSPAHRYLLQATQISAELASQAVGKVSIKSLGWPCIQNQQECWGDLDRSRSISRSRHGVSCGLVSNFVFCHKNIRKSLASFEQMRNMA